MDKIAILRPFTVDELQEEIQRRIKVKMGVIHTKTIRVICDHYKVRPSDVFSKSRKKEIQLCRHVAYYLLHKHFKISCIKTAEMLNKETHGAVLNGCTVIENRLSYDKDFQQELKEIINTLENK
jgi:chromosomal replication initiation ATPase DnaA